MPVVSLNITDPKEMNLMYQTLVLLAACAASAGAARLAKRTSRAL